MRQVVVGALVFIGRRYGGAPSRSFVPDLMRQGMASRDGQSSVRVKWRRGAQSQLASGRKLMPSRDRVTQLASPTSLPCAEEESDPGGASQPTLAGGRHEPILQEPPPQFHRISSRDLVRAHVSCTEW
jgi:hypothetical protein